MAGWFIILIGLMNLGAAVGLYLQNQQGMALAYFCYGVSNVGLYLASQQS